VQKDQRLAMARSVWHVDAVHLANNVHAQLEKLLHLT
jgi:hypothetical protein